MKTYVIEHIKFIKDYTIVHIATNEANGDKLYVVDGNLPQFELDYPEAKEYYEADWFQNFCPDSPGLTPLEKYLNALTDMTQPNPPFWSNIVSDIAKNRELFSKLLTTTEPNAFSALQTAIQYRNMELFTELALKVVVGIPEGLSQEETDSLNKILEDNYFPKLTEMSS